MHIRDLNSVNYFLVPKLHIRCSSPLFLRGNDKLKYLTKEIVKDGIFHTMECHIAFNNS